MGILGYNLRLYISMLFNWVQHFKNLINAHDSSLTRRTLLNMALRIACVVLLSAIFSYFHVMSSLESQTTTQLEKYIVERGIRESNNFLLAQDNLILLKEQLLQEFKLGISDKEKEVDLKSFFKWNDGTVRSLPQNYPKDEFDAKRYATTFIGQNVKLTNKLQQRFAIASKLISSFGRAWSNRFVNTYYIPRENGIAIYWKGIPWSLEAKSDTYFPNEEFYRIGEPQNNITRKPAWTGVYRDVAVDVSMVTAVVPVDDDETGDFLGIVGHDIVLTDLIDHTINERLPGAYNLMFRGDGHLIAHPEFMDDIASSKNQVNISDFDNSHLNRIFQLVSENQNQIIINNFSDKEYLAVTKIQGPDWYFVTVYPKSLLSGFAFDTVRFVLIAGIIALVVEIWLLGLVLRSSISKPLNELIDVTNKMASGDFDIEIDASRPDEIGQLTAAYNIMAIQLSASFSDLEIANSELENRVKERTIELQQVLSDLQQTQGQMIQKEKMSALGQMVTGIAHEINNPVNFVHGNISYVESYTNNLLQLLNSYQEYYPEPALAIKEQLEEIDFEFIRKDLHKILHSMEVGTHRIREIVISLRNFSRLDEAECKEVDIHEGIDNTLLILHHRLKATANQPAIEIIKDYGNLPQVECYAGQINQVFMNILSNAIDAVEELEHRDGGIISISTDVVDTNWVHICIADNGVGISDEISKRLFDPFFTTKSVGKGTGLGLSISYQIIVKTHHGKLLCNSILGRGTKFTIAIPIKHQLSG